MFRKIFHFEFNLFEIHFTDEIDYKGETIMLIQTISYPQPRIIVEFPLRKNDTPKYDADLYYSNGTIFDDELIDKVRVRNCFLII